MIAGLELPFLTDADPLQAGEGSLDPLGLARVAERLADTIAPAVTARMQRIRFVTAIAVGAVATDALRDAIATDGVSPAYLGFEWLLAEALARDKYLPSSATLRVPGIEKARSVVVRGVHMDSRSYLNTPKVFGFHGIYKRLARDFEIVDEHLLLGAAGDRLVRAWEVEQELRGFVDRKSGTPGGRVAANIQNAVRDALAQSRVTLSLTSHLWSKLVRALRPDGALSEERKVLFELLVDPREPIRCELVRGIQRIQGGEPEPVSVRALQRGASFALRERLRGIDAYERVAELLTVSLNTLRRISTANGTSPVSPDELGNNPNLALATSELPAALQNVYERLERLGDDIVVPAVVALSPFEGMTRPSDLVEALLIRHEAVQEAKGKRPWFENTPRGFVVRPLYRADDEPSIKRGYIHPYRINALRSFLNDLTP